LDYGTGREVNLQVLLVDEVVEALPRVDEELVVAIERVKQLLMITKCRTDLQEVLVAEDDVEILLAPDDELVVAGKLN
jgi:hypothetical protein